MLSTQLELLKSSEEILDRYRSFRVASCKIVLRLPRYIPKILMKQIGKKFGVLKRNTFILNKEDEFDVLFNYCFFHHYIDGKNAIDRFALANENTLHSEEKIALSSMRNASFAILGVEKTIRHGGVIVFDFMRQKRELLMDEGFSQSAIKGAMLATTVLRTPEFITTTGAALPLNNLLEKLKPFMENHIEEFNNFDVLKKTNQSKWIGEILKLCFQENASEYIEYRNIG